MISQTEKHTIAWLVFFLLLFPMLVNAASPFILCSSNAEKIARMAGLQGNYVSSIFEITHGADVLLVGDIFTHSDNGPIYDLQKKKCRMVRLDSPVASVLISRIKAYMRYTGTGKSVFDNPQEGMRYILYANLNSEIENFEPAGAINNKATNPDYQPRSLFSEIPDTGPGYVPPAMTRLVSSGSVGLDMNFAENSSELPDMADKILLELARMLKTNVAMKITVTGHTDYGYNTSAFNLELSRQRAEKVKSWLVKNGIGSSRISVAGFGDTKPLVVNDSVSHRPENRRIEIIRN